MEIRAETRSVRYGSSVSRGLLVVVVVAFVVRMGAWGVAERQVSAARAGGEEERRFVVAGDAEGYWDLAGDLLAGREYAVYTPPRRVLRTPGMPVAIAAGRAIFGDSPRAVRGWLTVLGVLGPVAVWWLARTVVDERTAAVAGGLAAVSPLLAAFAPLLLSESLFGAAITFQMGALAKAWRGERVAWPAMAGILGAVACSLRPAWAPAMAAICLAWPIAAWRAGRLRRGAGEIAALVAAFAVCWAPWVWRNMVVTGQPVLTTLWTGPTLYDSVGPQADGSSDMTFFDAEAERYAGWSEAAINANYLARSWNEIEHDPVRIARLAVAKQRRFWALFPTATEAGPRWLRVPIAGWTIAFFAAALVGIVIVDSPTRWFTIGPVLMLAAIHLLFVASMRYRLPAEYPLCVPAAVTLVRGWTRSRT